MYTRKELLDQLKERLVNQTKIVNKQPNDTIAYKHLSDVKIHIQSMENSHNGDSYIDLTDHIVQKYLVFENIDYRSQGNDHSEVSKTPIFKCCNSCCRALQFWVKEQTENLSGTYYSIGNYNGETLNKKIIVYPARTLAQSMDSDEMRINSEYLD